MVVAMALQQGIRSAWQVRTLPERVMETLLVFVPLDLFERGLQQFGASAKDIALVGAYVGMAGLLVVVGWFAVRTVDGWLVLGVGCVLWLVAMVVVMPLTGAGLFARGLFTSPLLTDAAYVCVFGGYAAVLAIGTGLLTWLDPGRYEAPEETAILERRSLLAGLGGTVVALVAFELARSTAGAGGGAAVQSSLPLAAAPTQPPTSNPTATLPAATAAPSGAPPTAGLSAPTTVVAVPAPVPAPTAVAAAAFPTPPPVRTLARDQDGSLTAAGRPPGSLAPPITSNADFYIVTKNAVADPVADANTWRLIVDGQVDHPVQVDYATLLALPYVDVTKTLECISNLTAGCSMASFGCDLMSTAVWRGVAASDVLNLAGGLKSNVVDVAFLSMDEFSSGLPAEVVMDPGTLVVYQMNGEVLPREHGYPARLLVPGRYGMKNPKWLAGIRALDQPYADWYQQRGWTRDGLIKTMSRIDVPADGATLTSGPQRVAGVAYAGLRGITRVEVSADGGSTWQPVSIPEPAAGPDAMVRWEGTFQMGSAPVNLVVRATDGSGAVQSDDFGLPAPDGSWGQDSITVQPA
ncbi:MAG: molybdopterin-dependent oxidoreductase [Chloroflexi bacterium]|nr:molybdopterin-dependent oxidoreductase [Chloroflexota bacterium]